MNFQAASKTKNFHYAIRDLIPYATKIEDQGHQILKLNIGDPLKFDFKIPQSLKDAVIENIQKTGPYGRSEGNIEACEALAQNYQTDIDNIRIGNGASEVIANFLGALIEPGMEVLIPCPDYPLYTSYTSFFGGKPIHYMCDEANGWQPNLADIEAKITSQTRAIVLINPNNPTGAVYHKDILQEIINLSQKHHLLIISDEVYDKLLYDDATHIPTASLSKTVPIFTIGSLSKNTLVPGWRAGWMIKHDPENRCDELWEGMTRLCRARLSPNTLAQYAIKPALNIENTHYQDLIGNNGSLTRRRNILMDQLANISGISCVKPKGAFYAFPKITAAKPDDKQFVLDFLETHHVLMVHGTGFNYPTPDHLRIVFLPDEETLALACKKLEEFIKSR